MADRFDPHDNGLTPLRLILALLVVFSHSWVAGGFGSDPLYTATGGQMQIGTVAVIAFFALSGFLLTGTRARRSRAEFAWHRLLRIAPGLVVNVVVTIGVIVPVAAAIGGTVPPMDQLFGWMQAVFTAHLTIPLVPGSFPGALHADTPNASLWTLSIEIWCYVLLCIAPARWSFAALTGLLVAAAGWHVMLGGQELIMHLPIAFAIGGLMAWAADRVPLHGAIAAAIVILTLGSAWMGALALVAPFTLPYVAVWAAVASPLRWTRDLSYGTYIYAWPLQRLLAVAGLAAGGLVPYLLADLVAILGAAYLSVRLIEEPALRLRRLLGH